MLYRPRTPNPPKRTADGIEHTRSRDRGWPARYIIMLIQGFPGIHNVCVRAVCARGVYTIVGGEEIPRIMF